MAISAGERSLHPHGNRHRGWHRNDELAMRLAPWRGARGLQKFDTHVAAAEKKLGKTLQGPACCCKLSCHRRGGNSSLFFVQALAGRGRPL